MKVKELFKPVDVSHWFSEIKILLDRNNCVVVSKSKNPDAVILTLRRDEDGEEGHAYLRVRDEFMHLSTELLKWGFICERIMGLNLEQVEELETDLEIENVAGRIQLVENN